MINETLMVFHMHDIFHLLQNLTFNFFFYKILTLNFTLI